MTTHSPRLLVIMGSGETTANMVAIHREVISRLGSAPSPGVVLDTPFGFQLNANEVAERIRRYFADSLGQELVVADFPSSMVDPLRYEAMLLRLRQAPYVFSGPGNATYALRHWRESGVPGILRDKLRTGGAIAVSSAAALAAGATTVPVHEIYRMGEEPHWLDGLDLLAEAGISAAVIPHYDNADGGTHDTRFCFLGEERLSLMEELLPAKTFVLGVDEQTALILDLNERTACVRGRGGVTVRRRGASTRIEPGETVKIKTLVDLGQPESAAPPRHQLPNSAVTNGAPTPDDRPLDRLVGQFNYDFADAISAGDRTAATVAVLGLEELLAARVRGEAGSNQFDKARSVLRSMLAQLCEWTGKRQEVAAPFIDALVDLRAAARSRGDWAEADAVRDQLLALAVELHDEPGATTWTLS